MKDKRLFLLGFMVFALSSCQALFFEDRSGQAIRFSASAGNGPVTRTVYSGEQYSDGPVYKEKIKWTNGDPVRIYLYLENAPGYKYENTYGDYTVTWSNDDRYISRGTLSDSETPLRWVGTADDHVSHKFYSIYPAGYSGNLSQEGNDPVVVSFNGLASQDGTMNYAYMAAVAGPYYMEDKEVRENKVDLNYYPMVTTVYVTVENASGSDLNLSATLRSKENTLPLAGPYKVQLKSDGVFTPIVDTKSGTFVSQLTRNLTLRNNSAPGSVMFFLLPENYQTANLNLTLSGGGKNYSFDLNESGVDNLLALHKYNVTVKLNKGGGSIDIGDLDAGGAQILAMLIKNLLTNQKTAELLNNYYSTTDQNYFSNNIWGKFDNLMKDSNFDNLTIDALVDALTDKGKNVDGLDMLRVLLEYIQKTTTNASIKLSPDLTHNVSAEELQLILPNAKTIDLQISQNVPSERRPVVVEAAGLPNLESLYIHHPQEVIVKDCESLTSLVLDNAESSFTKLEMKNCALSSFSFNSANAPNAAFVFEEMPKLTEIYVEKAGSVTATSCPELITVKYNKNYGTSPVITVTACPKYKGVNYN